MTDFEFRPDDALIIIDPQNDFCPGGSLAVNEGDQIMRTINAAAMAARGFGAQIVVTQDWHPESHMSFAKIWGKQPFETAELDYGTQTLWPAHCVQGTKGADFHPDVATAVNYANIIIRKGMNRQVDSYSAFKENDGKTTTGLAGWLREKGIRRCIFVGLAYDFCVAWSALDARKEGFDAVVLKDLTRAIAAPTKERKNGPDGPFENDTDTATVMESTMKTSGVEIITNETENA